jgi:hypothetical protein
LAFSCTASSFSVPASAWRSSAIAACAEIPQHGPGLNIWGIVTSNDRGVWASLDLMPGIHSRRADVPCNAWRFLLQ